jgi:histidinol-phosphate aminotransferase
VAFTDATRTHNDIWRDWLARKLTALGLGVMPSVGNFLLVRFAAEKDRDADAADAYLARRGIVPRKVAGYGLPDCLRITIGTEAETRAVAEALADFLSGKPA